MSMPISATAKTKKAVPKKSFDTTIAFEKVQKALLLISDNRTRNHKISFLLFASYPHRRNRLRPQYPLPFVQRLLPVLPFLDSFLKLFSCPSSKSGPFNPDPNYINVKRRRNAFPKLVVIFSLHPLGKRQEWYFWAMTLVSFQI